MGRLVTLCYAAIRCRSNGAAGGGYRGYKDSAHTELVTPSARTTEGLITSPTAGDPK
jgi:hypothetical protein